MIKYALGMADVEKLCRDGWMNSYKHTCQNELRAFVI